MYQPYKYLYGPTITRFPIPIAKNLRIALYYSNISPDPDHAMKYYKAALRQCDDFHLDPLSDEVLGLKVHFAGWLESLQNYDGSIRALEWALRDCNRWLAKLEQAQKDGTLDRKLPTLAPPFIGESDDGSAGNSDKDAGQDESAETVWGRRTRILGKSVGISLKLGEIYSDNHVRKPEVAHEHLLWAVNTALRESARRANEEIRPGEGVWMTPDAVGASLESTFHPSLQPDYCSEGTAVLLPNRPDSLWLPFLRGWSPATGIYK